MRADPFGMLASLSESLWIWSRCAALISTPHHERNHGLAHAVLLFTVEPPSSVQCRMYLCIINVAKLTAFAELMMLCCSFVRLREPRFFRGGTLSTSTSTTTAYLAQGSE
jgi:hypothetical protein